jgi:predicted transposase YdaD
MSDMDQGIKRLIQMFPGDIIAFARPGAEYVSAVPAEVAMERQLIMDTLFRARYHGFECLFNIEAQTDIDREMPRRLADYAARARSIYGLPVISVVLWLKQKGNVPQPPFEEWLDDLFVSSHNFINIEIYRLEARDILQLGMAGLLPLIPLMRGADVETDTAAMAAIDQSMPDPLKLSASELLAVFIARQFNDQDLALSILRRFFMSTELLDESPLYREWIRKARVEGITEGKAEGIAEGKAEGKVEGIAEGSIEALRESIRVVLQSRFGAIDPDLVALIDSLDASTLRVALPHIATETLVQIQAWFQQQAQPPQ